MWPCFNKMQINDFLYATNSKNILPLLHKKVISSDTLQNIYPNLARIYENMLIAKPFYKKNYYGITDFGVKKPISTPPESSKMIQCVLQYVLQRNEC